MAAGGEKIRRYVDVIARWHDDGRVTPLSVCWADGRTFQIEAVLGEPVANAFPGAPSRTLRYSVRVGGRTTLLYLEREERGKEPVTRWYVESPAGREPWKFA